MLLQSRPANNRFDRLLTASLVAVLVLVCLRLLCSIVIDLAGTVRNSGSPVAEDVVQPHASVLTSLFSG